MSTVVKDLGAVSAYAYAVEKGYTGTEAEFAELMASYATVGQTAVTAAQTATTKASEAATSATTATNKAGEATTAAQTATTKAGEASTSASTATSAKDTAVSAASTATTKATEATTAAATATSAATTATTAKDDAVSAKTAAQTAQTGAETAAASVSASAAQIQTNADDISELKEDTTQLKSDLHYSLEKKLSEWEQGAFANSTGVPTTSSTFVRNTNFFEIESISLIDKPKTIQLYYFVYDANKNYIARHGTAHTVAWTGNGASILADEPTGKYVRFDASVSLQTTTPQDIINSALDIEILHNVGPIKSTVDALDADTKQFFKYENTDITESLTFNVPMGSEKYKNMIVKSNAMYEGTTAPTIEVTRKWQNSNGSWLEYYGTPKYKIGGAGTYKMQEWRVPQWIEGYADYVTVKITIPSDTTLHIKNLSNVYDDTICRSGNGIHLNAHDPSGFGGPAQTLYQYTMAAKLGYRYCITIPKVTSDGVYVCLHDDDSIQGTARNDDGTAIASEYQNRPVSDFTYAELLQFDFGIYRGLPFKGSRIPLLSDFFKICARTGMHPMLSVHPSLSGHWDNIKAMAEKYGVLSTLNIKSDSTNIEVPMAVLGNGIESYTIDISTNGSEINRFNSLTSTYSLQNVKRVIEYNNDVLTDALISNVLTNGYKCGVFNYGYDTDRMLELYEKGVTEFTEDHNASVGLNWD